MSAWTFVDASIAVSGMFIESPDHSLIAIAAVPHQPCTAHGAVVLWREGDEHYAEFYNAEVCCFAEVAPLTPEGANIRFRELCRRFWVGMPEDTRPCHQLDEEKS